jgi:phosphoglycolate phosphatase
MLTLSALVFDLDGTLIDSRGDIVRSCNRALVASGRAPLPAAAVESLVGDGSRTLVARAAGLPEADPAVDGLLAAFLEDYLAHPVEHTSLLPGVLAALDALDGWPLAVCTNKARGVTLKVLAALGISSRFAAVIAGGDTPDRKPSPGPVLAALAALGVGPAQAALVGDSPVDVAAGRAAGVLVVAIPGPFVTTAQLAAAGPDVLLSSIDALPAWSRAARGPR